MAKMNWDRVRSENSYIKYRDQETIYVNDKRFYAGDGEMLNDKDYSKWSYGQGTGSKKRRKKKKKTTSSKISTSPLSIKIKNEVFLLVEIDQSSVDIIRKTVKKEGKYDFVLRLFKKEAIKLDEFSKIRTVLFKAETNYYRVLINKNEDLELLFSGICVTCRNIEEIKPQFEGLSKYRISYESNGTYGSVKIYVKAAEQQAKITTKVPGQEKNKHNPIKKGRQQNDSWKIPAKKPDKAETIQQKSKEIESTNKTISENNKRTTNSADIEANRKKNGCSNTKKRRKYH